MTRNPRTTVSLRPGAGLLLAAGVAAAMLLAGVPRAEASKANRDVAGAAKGSVGLEGTVVGGSFPFPFRDPQNAGGFEDEGEDPVAGDPDDHPPEDPPDDDCQEGEDCDDGDNGSTGSGGEGFVGGCGWPFNCASIKGEVTGGGRTWEATAVLAGTEARIDETIR